MSIYATLWGLRFPRRGRYCRHTEWVTVLRRALDRRADDRLPDPGLSDPGPPTSRTRGAD